MIRLLSNDEIVTRLKSYFYDARYTGSRQIPMTSIAELCDLHDDTIFRIMGGGVVTEKSRQILSTVLLLMEQGHIDVKPRGVTLFPDPPSVQPPPQDKIARADEWSRWAPCRTCSGTQWREAWRRLQNVMVCLQCIPEEQWKALHLDTKLNKAYKPRRKWALTNWQSSANSVAATAKPSLKVWRRPRT